MDIGQVRDRKGLKRLVVALGSWPTLAFTDLCELAREGFRGDEYLRVHSNGVEQFDDMAKQNMAMFENAMKMMTPFASQETGQSTDQKSPEAESQSAGTQDRESKSGGNVDYLKAQLDAMQSQIEGLMRDRKS